VLSVSENLLSELPDGIGDLIQMTNLILNDNALTGLPFGFSKLTEKKLIELQLQNNKFADRKIKYVLFSP
jgi:Leucine-rich repeat (LRR) protein